MTNRRSLVSACLAFGICHLAFGIGHSLGIGHASFVMSSASQAPQSVFRSGVDVITADVTVVDRNGRLVTDLAPADFVVTLDGKPRPIVSSEFVSHERREPGPAAQRRARFVSSNENVSTGRLVLFVADTGNTTANRGRAVMRVAGRLLDRLNPDDRVALVTIPASRVSVEFTRDRQAVRQAFGRVAGWAPPLSVQYHVSMAEALELERAQGIVPQGIAERICLSPEAFEICKAEIEQQARALAIEIRARQAASLGALEGVLRAIGQLEGSKTLILLSEGMVTEGLTSPAQTIGRLAAAAQASIYIVRPEASIGDVTDNVPRYSRLGDERLQLEGLEMVAGIARGALFRVTDEGERVIDAVAGELAGYYMLGFEAAAPDRDGRPHKVQIEVRRPNLTVRARREIVLDRQARIEDDESLLAATMRAPVLAIGLPLRVTTYTMADRPGGKVRLVVSAEIGPPATGEAPVAVAFTLLRPDGRLAASGLERANLPRLDPAKPSPLHYLRTAPVDPGQYTLKVAAVDARGTRGSVEHLVSATAIRTSSLSLGDLIVTEPGETAGEGIRPGVDPVVRGGVVQLVLPVHSANARDLAERRIALEIAESEEGAAVASADARLGVGDSLNAGSRLAQATLPVHTLPAGDYVARAVVFEGGAPGARIVRPFRVEPDPMARRAARAAREPGPPPGATAVTAPSSRTPGDRLMMPPFQRQEVLTPDLVGRAIDRLTAASPSARPSAAAAAAMTAAREGRIDALAGELPRLTDQTLAAAFLRGLALFSKGELEPAAMEFRAAIRLSPDFLPAVFYLGACYAAGGRDREAVGAWQAALFDDDAPPAMYRVTAEALLRLGQAPRAVALLTQAQAAAPADVDVARQLAAAHALAGDYAKALAVILPLAEQDPRPETLLLALRLLNEIGSSGQAYENPQSDFDRFVTLQQRYDAAQGTEGALVERWRAGMDRRR
jgi:VWFA-related protein